ncbi:MAG: hypothetical protein A4E48_00799 [Methanosaeta sp. PtaU1.Bin060]|nr:MAG: hypothetical protein A4E48_00799 [Methanosaeta sp. PtaU1.Bin060]
MQRVYGVVEDDLVHRIDEAAGERGISRAQWIRDSILAYLHRGGEDLETETVNLRAEAVKLQTLCGEKSQEIAVLKEALAVKDGELVHLRDIEAKSREVMAEATQRWEEIKGLKADLARAKRDLDGAKGEAVKARSEAAQAATALQDAQLARLLLDIR